MKLKEAIKRADEIRPNAISDELKAAWIYEVEGQIAEMMGRDAPANEFPKDAPLLMPSPHDNIYYLYCAAMIDFAQQDTETYYNDMTLYNAAMSDACGWYRRHNMPTSCGNWRV
jgi:hypothetical protein